MSNAQKPAGFKSELGSGNDFTELQRAAFDMAMREAEELRAHWLALEAAGCAPAPFAAAICERMPHALAAVWRSFGGVEGSDRG